MGLSHSAVVLLRGIGIKLGVTGSDHLSLTRDVLLGLEVGTGSQQEF
jgi:hypothetical protein